MKQIFFVLLTGAMLWSQTDQARFTGTVTDATGAVLPGAQLKIINQKTNQERLVSASEQGVFFVNGLLPSTYKVEASSTGFSPAVFEGIELGVGQARTLNITLQAAGVTTEVTISAGGLAEVHPRLADPPNFQASRPALASRWKVFADHTWER